MKIELGSNQIDDSRSIFIRGGESGFMIYWVKSRADAIERACPVELHDRCYKSGSAFEGCHGLAPWSLTIVAT